MTMLELMKPSWCPSSNACLICDVTADIQLKPSNDESSYHLELIHHLLAWKIIKQDETPTTEPSEVNSPCDSIEICTCLVAMFQLEGHACGTGHGLKLVSKQHCQLAKLFVKLTMSDRSEMQLIADCHGATEVNLTTELGFYSMISSIEPFERLDMARACDTELYRLNRR